MTVAWPTTPDSLPRPAGSTKRNAPGFELHAVLDDISTVLERLQSVASGELFINGNYDWWQRIEGGSQTCTTSFSAITSFGPDRMFTLPAGASVTVARSATTPGVQSIYSCAITGAASVTTVDHGQRLRFIHRKRYQQSLVFSAYVRNESGAAFTPTLRVDTPGSADSWGSPTNRLSQSLQSCADSAWTQVYHVFDPSAYTNIDLGLSVYLRIPSGSLVSGDVVRIAQMSLRPGIALVPYLSPDYEVEKIRCLPYYRKSYSDGVALQTNTAVGLVGGGFFASGGQNAYFQVPFAPPMWKIPAVRLWGKAGTANQFWNPATVTDSNASQATDISTNGFTLGNNTTNSEVVQAHYDAVAELT